MFFSWQGNGLQCVRFAATLALTYLPCGTRTSSPYSRIALCVKGGEEVVERLGQGRVREDGVTQDAIGELAEHGQLHG